MKKRKTFEGGGPQILAINGMEEFLAWMRKVLGKNKENALKEKTKKSLKANPPRKT